MSEPADATTTSAPANATPPNAPTWPRRLWLTGRILVTIGAVGLALSSWMWWWQVSGFDSSSVLQSGTHYVLLLSPGDILPPFGNEFYIHVLTVAGLLLLPLLWLFRSTRFPWVNLLIAFIILQLASLAGSQALNPYWDYQGGIADLVPSLTPRQLIRDGPPHYQLGWTLNLASFLIIALGLATLLVAEARALKHSRTSAPQLQQPQPARPRLARLPAAGGLTLGLIIFLIGVLGMGWTAVNCTDRPLFLGNCTGLAFTGVLHYGIATQTDAFNPIAALFAIPTLLVGGAILVVVGLWWWRRLTPGLSLWITLYLATATFFFIVGYAGTGAIAAHSADLGLQPGTWTAQAGLWVAALGLLIGWLALIPLWFRALRPASTATATTTA